LVKGYRFNVFRVCIQAKDKTLVLPMVVRWDRRDPSGWSISCSPADFEKSLWLMGSKIFLRG